MSVVITTVIEAVNKAAPVTLTVTAVAPSKVMMGIINIPAITIGVKVSATYKNDNIFRDYFHYYFYSQDRIH